MDPPPEEGPLITYVGELDSGYDWRAISGRGGNLRGRMLGSKPRGYYFVVESNGRSTGDHESNTGHTPACVEPACECYFGI